MTQSPSGSRAARVLVVDDHEPTRQEICRLLRCDGHTAIPSRQGLEAQWCVESWAGRVDLVITDLLPPEPDGYNLAITYGRILPHTPMLFLGTLPQAEAVRRGFLHQSAPYLRKPWPPALLRRRVREALEHGPVQEAS